MLRRSFLKSLAGLPLVGGVLAAAASAPATRWFQHSSGTLVAIGYDGKTGEAAPNIISWNDPSTGSWDADIRNQAGKVYMPFNCNLKNIREVSGAIQIDVDRYTIAMLYVGGPLIWTFSPTQKASTIHDPGHTHGHWSRI